LGLSPPAEIHQQVNQTRTIYASFWMGDQEFALDVRRVQEVVNLPAKISPMPLSPDFVVGVFNLRGAIIPVLSMTRLLNGESEGQHAGEKVVIVEHSGVRLGLLFDNTNRVLRPRGEEETVFGYEDGSTRRVVAGVLKIGEDLIRVLDLDRLVAIEDIPQPHSPDGVSNASWAKRTRKQQCITFRVGNMLLGFAINGVHELVPAKGIERSPIQGGLCAGLMHIRENIVPVVHFRDLLQVKTEAVTNATDEQRVIVLKIGQMHVGLLVDAVEAIDAYDPGDVLPVPILTRNRANMFTGCIDLGERGHMFLLDSQCVMDHDEVSRITGEHSSLFTAKENKVQTTRKQAGMHQSFLWFVTNQAFAIPLREVREIIDCADGLIAMPGAPDFVSGMYNLRGKLVTVVDMRKFYQLGDAPDTELLDRKVVVLDNQDTLLGLQVDSVHSILHMDAHSKYPVPSLLHNALKARTRHDVSEVICAQNEGNKVTHLLLLDAARIFASIGEREVDVVDA